MARTETQGRDEEIATHKPNDPLDEVVAQLFRHLREPSGEPRVRKRHVDLRVEGYRLVYRVRARTR